ncbi:MAG: type II/IV secretion system protein [Geobacteraceae bacterium]|nr:type II/IV secretion system protein [Geobacteraceae bacterium]NTW80792.1 type II/IV secretion system protein [Geobacteraceae bacterium]
MILAPNNLGDLLISTGKISAKQLRIALIQQRVTGTILGETLISLGFLTSQEFAQTIALQSGLEYLDLRTFTLSEQALRLIPKETALTNGYIPLELDEGILSIGIMTPSNVVAVDSVLRLTGKPPKVYLVDQEAYGDIFERAYYFSKNSVQQRLEEFAETLKNGEVIPGAIVPELTELLIMDGILKMASDIHMTPSDEVLHIFYRIDGVLTYGHCLPKIIQAPLASRIKILADLDITEQRLPQDGSFTLAFLKKKYDLRISTAPSIYGENIVTRVLSTNGALKHISTLGLNEDIVDTMRQLFNKSHGIILITGPTGSGKTTTLYSCLREIDLLEKNVITIEDPVEYRLNFVRQTEVNEKTGYTFASSARTFMRQDPDVMLLGEIRDKETAQIAIRGSITGHLLLSTLHATDAVASIPRLLELGMDKLLLSSTLLAVLAQRLVRRICHYCKEEYELSEKERKVFHRAGMDVARAYRGAGCSRCGNSGFAGRTSIAEVMVMNTEIKEQIYAGASMEAIFQAAQRGGLVPLFTEGLNQVIAGHTTLQEVQRVVG